jgi:Integrase core domain
LIRTGSQTRPWENSYCESFNSKVRDEFLNGEIFYSMKELRVLTERWRVHYNTIRPYSSLGRGTPAPGAWLTISMGHGEVETAYALPTSPHPRRRLPELRNSHVALTHSTAQKIGTPSPFSSSSFTMDFYGGFAVFGAHRCWVEAIVAAHLWQDSNSLPRMGNQIRLSGRDAV